MHILKPTDFPLCYDFFHHWIQGSSCRELSLQGGTAHEPWCAVVCRSGKDPDPATARADEALQQLKPACPPVQLLVRPQIEE